MDRINQFKKILESHKLDGFIITNATNIFYLCGFRGISPSEREAILVFSPGRVTLITARLYQNEAQRLASGKLAIKIVNERNEIFKLAQKLFAKAHKVGFEEQNLTYQEFKEFSKALSYLGSDPQEKTSSFQKGPTLKKFIPSKNLIEDLRIIKTNQEIRRIERAQKISQAAFEELVKTLKVGQTEEEIAERLSRIIKSKGGQGFAFETIVAAGPNSGKPHHFTTDRRLTNNDILLLDFGAKYQNYCADLSRTIFVGRARDHHRHIYDLVLKAQKKALEKIIHGTKTHQAFHAVNNLFKSQKLDKYFIHGLGHGVGLEVHEKPYLRPNIKENLLENMVFSIEPGLYFPDFGVRIEDLVVIQNGHGKVLGKQLAQFIQIG